MQPNTSVLKEDCDDGYTTLWIYQKHYVVYFRYINCTVCELYLNKVVTKKKRQKIMPGGPGLLEVEPRAILVGTGNTADLNILASGSKNEVSLNWIRIHLVNFPWATLCGLLSSKDPTCHAFQSGGPSQSGENWSQGWQSTRCKTNSINGSIQKPESNTVDLEICKQ